METGTGRELFGRLMSRALLFIAFLALAFTLGSGIAQFMSDRVSIPRLFTSFLPSAVVASLLLFGFVAVRSQEGVLPSFTFPRLSPPLMLASLLGIFASGFLIALAATATVDAWGIALAVPILVAFAALIAVFWLSLSSIVNALALYFAIWPVLAYINFNIILQRERDLHQSLLIVPMRITAQGIEGGSRWIADDFWSQLALMSPEALFIFVIFIGWILSWHRSSPIRLLPKSINWAVAVLLGAGLVSALRASTPVFSLLWFLGELVAPVLIFYMVASAVQGEQGLLRIFWGMLAGIALVALYHLFFLYQFLYVYGFSLSQLTGGISYNPVLGNPNFAGAVLAYLLPAPLAILLHPQVKGSGKTIAFAALAVATAAILLTASRGAVLGLAVFALGVVLLIPRARILVLPTLVLLVLVFLTFLQPIIQITTQMRPGVLSTPIFEEPGVAARLSIWGQSLQLILSPLILGIGPGQFQTLGLFYSGVPSRIFEHAHQDFLTLSIETGLIGLSAFILIVIIVGWHAYRLISSLETSPYRNALTSVTLGLLVFLTVSTTTGVPFSAREGLAAGLIPWALAGILMSAIGSRKDTVMDRENKATRQLLQ